MIKELNIRNFQSHKDTTLKFHPGVNVILGTTDSGKTAIIRALKWVVQNKPTGEDFRSSWGGDTVVIATTKEGVVSRRKGDRENSYMLYKYNDPGESIFTAFGSTVPEPIQQFFNMEEVNLQQQLDSPFLLSQTPGQVAQYFNRIAGIDIIDTATKNVNKSIQDTKRSSEYKKNDIEKKKCQLDNYATLDVFEVKLEELEQLEKTRLQTVRLYSSLETTINRLKQVNEKIAKCKKVTTFESRVNALFTKLTNKNENELKKDRFVILLNKVKKVNKQLKKIAKITTFENTVNTTLQISRQKQQETAKFNRFNLLVGKYTTVTKRLQETAKIIAQKQTIFDEHLTVCPLCGTKIR
jgi:exonuclease SbcC